MRATLKKARQEAGLTQQQMATAIGVSLRYYKKIEKGDMLGSIELWDALEDITGIHQRKLREQQAIRRAPEDNR